MFSKSKGDSSELENQVFTSERLPRNIPLYSLDRLQSSFNRGIPPRHGFPKWHTRTRQPTTRLPDANKTGHTKKHLLKKNLELQIKVIKD